MQLNIAYSSDDNYAKYLGISLLSVLDNNSSDFDKICVYILDNGIKKDNKNKILEIGKQYYAEINFVEFKSLCKKLKTDGEFSITSFGRIFLSNLKDVDKILYLDCDSIVCDSFKELWNMDISNYYIAGVLDNVYPFFKEWIGLPKETSYVNAGFLLINLDLWRKNNLEEEMLKFINKYNGTVPHHDQGTINAICYGKVLLLHPKYNFQPPMLTFSNKQIKKMSEDIYYYSDKELKEANEQPCFIHFTADIYNRPWFNPCTHPMKDKYIEYMLKSPWGNIIQDKELPKKAKITGFIQTHFPFFIYNLYIKIIKLKKYSRLKKKYEKE